MLGTAAGCLLAGKDPQILTELSQKLSPEQSGDFLSGVTQTFAADALLLGIFFLCGFGAIFQPVVFMLLFLKGYGFGILGIYCYSAGDSSHALYYLCALLPQALAEALLLTKAAEESIAFSLPFLFKLLGKEPEEENSCRPAFYILRFLLFYLFFGSICFGAGILKHFFAV